MSRLLWILPVLCIILLPGVALAQPDTPTFEPAPCSFNTPTGFAIECGYVTVPESRDPALADDTNTLRLAVAIMRGHGPHIQNDPLIYLDGGPGGRTLDTVEFLAASFDSFLVNRDVIFFDQRGVGLSNPLDCPEYVSWSYDILDQDIPYAELVEISNEVLLACRDRSVAEGINLAAYTTAENAADVRDMAAALGYEQVNLMGASYGTRLALTVMRDYPEIVRSVVLDAVLPLQVNPDVEFLPNAHRAFSTLFTACAQDPACNQQYPDLEAVFYETVAQLNAEPEVVTVFDFYTAQQRDVLINGDSLIGGLFGLLYQTMEIPNLPRYIYEAHNGSYDGFVDDLLFSVFQGAYFDETLFVTVGCNEEMPFEQLEDVRAGSEDIPLALSEIFLVQIEGDFQLCGAWGTGTADDAENAPVVSDIPTLVMVGEFDPITPPGWAYLAAETLSNSYVYELPGIGHTTFTASSCAASMILGFIDHPDDAPNTDCIASMAPPLFAIAEITSVENQPFTHQALGFRSVVPENWYEVEPGVFSPYPALDPVVIPVLAFRFPVTLDDYVSRIIVNGFYARDSLPTSTATVRANGREWQIYQVERPDEEVYTSFAFFEGDRAYVIGVTATSEQEREFLYDALFIPAIEAFEIIEPVDSE